MTFLVTGGAGFIGSHIAYALRKQGASVRILDDFSSGTRENLLPALHVEPHAGLEIVEADLRDPAAVKLALRGIETVFHEAAFVSVPGSLADPVACYDVNCTGTLNLLEAARRHGVRRVVLASSAAIYGDQPDLPLSEMTSPRPLSPYAASKLVDETYAVMYSRSMGLEVCALRYFNVYGPRQRPDTPYAAAVPIFIRSLLDRKPPTIFGDGGQSRDLIYVGDVVRANLLAADHSAAAGQVFNICTGRKTRILDLVATLSELIPDSPLPLFDAPRKGDIYESLGSPEKARAMLGFSGLTSLRAGLEETIKWMA